MAFFIPRVIFRKWLQLLVLALFFITVFYLNIKVLNETEKIEKNITAPIEVENITIQSHDEGQRQLKHDYPDISAHIKPNISQPKNDQWPPAMRLGIIEKLNIALSKKINSDLDDMYWAEYNRKKLVELTQRCGDLLVPSSEMQCKPSIVFLWDIYYMLLLTRDMFGKEMVTAVALGETIVLKSLLYGLEKLGYLHLVIFDPNAYLFYYKLFSNHMVLTITEWNYVYQADDNHFFTQYSVPKCKFLIFDFFMAMPYVRDKTYNKGFAEEQYLIPYPTNYVNTFLGFIQEPCANNGDGTIKQKSGLVWGKEQKYFLKQPTWNWKVYTEIKKRWPNLKLLGTCRNCTKLPEEIENLNPMKRSDFLALLSKQQFLLSLGHPQDGPTALEALSCGVPVINVVYTDVDVYERRKTIIQTPGSKHEKSERLMEQKSQHQYLEHFTQPLVYHIKQYNSALLMEAIDTILRSSPIDHFVPTQFTEKVYLQRLQGILEKQWCI